jgi:hypothetical protein
MSLLLLLRPYRWQTGKAGLPDDSPQSEAPTLTIVKPVEKAKEPLVIPKLDLKTGISSLFAFSPTNITSDRSYIQERNTGFVCISTIEIINNPMVIETKSEVRPEFLAELTEAYKRYLEFLETKVKGEFNEENIFSITVISSKSKPSSN